jgi:aminodeoxyfutalosine deaminase
MNYRKFKATRIFDGYRFLDDEMVLIVDEAARVQDVVPQHSAGDNVQIFDGILSPGFINCHCHLELSHLKGKILRDTGLVNFVSQVMQRRNVDISDVLEKISIAEAEMMSNGIVAVGDICNTTQTLLQKNKGNLRYYNFVEATGFIESNASARFDQFKVIADQLSSCGKTSVVPHAPYSVSKRLLSIIAEEANGKTLSLHNQETEAETHFFATATGDFINLYQQLGVDISHFEAPNSSSLNYTLNELSFNGNLILVHNVTTSRADILAAKEKASEAGLNIYWCFCPNANLYISNTLPDIQMFIEENVQIVLGTDSLASNDQLNLLSEIQTIHDNFPSTSLEHMLQWATSNGAKALQFDTELGSFEKGKTPGIMLIENVQSDLSLNSATVRRLI